MPIGVSFLIVYLIILFTQRFYNPINPRKILKYSAMKEKCESILMQPCRNQCILQMIYYTMVWAWGFSLLRTIFQWTCILKHCWNSIHVLFCLPRYGCGFKACPPAGAAACLSQKIQECREVLPDRPPCLLPILSFHIHSPNLLTSKLMGSQMLPKGLW